MIDAESRFLRRFFTLLKEAKVRYAVMRNWESLPDSMGGSDLDLLSYDDNEAGVIADVAYEVAREFNGACTIRYKVEATILCFAGRYDDGVWWGIHIDIFPGLLYFGIPYMKTDPVFEERVLVGDCFYRCGSLSDVASFVKEIMPNHRTKKDYYPRACQAYAANPENVKNAMIDCFGKSGWQVVKGLLEEQRDAKRISADSKKMVRALWWRQISRLHWLSLVKINSRNVYQRLRRLFFKPGVAIAFLGTDGSGKSTLIENIKEPLERMLHSKIHYEHLRPNLLPYLAQLKGQKPTGKPCTDPHGGKVSGWLGSLIRFSYYYLDYIFGYWLKIYPILVKRPSMVFFDRYYYEYIIDPRRCAVKLPRGWAKFWGWFIPKPDLILCLGGDPAKIYARKPETSLEEVTRQVKELKAFCERNRHAVWIDTTLSIEESKNAALTAITTFMSKSQK